MVFKWPSKDGDVRAIYISMLNWGRHFFHLKKRTWKTPGCGKSATANLKSSSIFWVVFLGVHSMAYLKWWLHQRCFCVFLQRKLRQLIPFDFFAYIFHRGGKFLFSNHHGKTEKKIINSFHSTRWSEATLQVRSRTDSWFVEFPSPNKTRGVSPRVFFFCHWLRFSSDFASRISRIAILARRNHWGIPQNTRRIRPLKELILFFFRAC